MPYQLSKDGLCVVKKDSGDSVPGGCHKTHAEALAHLRALEVNVEDAKAEEIKADEVKATAPDSKGVIDSKDSRPVIRVLANPYGGPNNGKDEHGQYFSPRTQFHADRLPLPPAVYYHGTNPDGTPAGLPDFIGPTIGRGVDPQKGVWYDVALDTQNSEMAKRLAATPSDRLRASSGVVPATKRIAKDGHIDSWMNGEISVFDLGTSRKPINDYAVGTHIKAMFEKAGIDPKVLNTAASGIGNSMNPLDVLIAMVQAWWSSMQGADTSATANAGKDAGAVPTPDAANKAAATTEPPPQTQPMPAATAATVAPVAGAATPPNELHVHYHAPDANQPADDAVPPVPAKKDEKAMTNQKDDSMKAQVDALTAALRGRVVVEAESWAMALMKSGKMLPAEKPHAVETYVTLTCESENMKSLAPALEHFKLAYEQREPHPLLNDAAAAKLSGAGFETQTDEQKAKLPMTAERRSQLLGSSLVGQAVLRERVAQGVK